MPNETWHIDTILIRLLDDTRVFLRRRILAWRVFERFGPENTVTTLLEATNRMAPTDVPPTMLADAGVENVNARVDELISSSALRRLLAMTEIAFSNSMIESWWRTLKHQWLYLNTLDTVASLQEITASPSEVRRALSR